MRSDASGASSPFERWFAAQVILGPADAGDGWHDTVPLWAVIKHRRPDLCEEATRSAGQLGDIRVYADALRETASDVLRGNFGVFAAARAIVEAHSVQLRIHQLEEARERIRSAAVAAAADAFRARDFRRVVELLMPHADLLTPAERARLAYARARPVETTVLSSAGRYPDVKEIGEFCGYRIGRSDVPHLRAEVALREALTASATGTLPETVDLRLPPDSLRPAPGFFAQPYRLEYVDNYLAGTRGRDLLAPGWLVWTIHFADEKNWEANVLATSDSTHVVFLKPDER